MNEAALRWLLRDKYGVVCLAGATAELAQQQVLEQKGGEAAVELSQDLQRLAGGEPLAYVIGWVPFLQAHIDLSERTLIPRPETEFWVEQVISEILTEAELLPRPQAVEQDAAQTLRVLDVCCGSGCIGISLLQAIPDAVVTFSDISASAVSQTTLNLELNKISVDRFTVKVGNLFEAISGQFDYILTNPPYINPEAEHSGDLKFEPPEALFAQKGGLGLIEEIILNSKKYLKISGKVILEFGKGQENQIEKMAKQAGWERVKVMPDQYQIPRWVELG